MWFSLSEQTAYFLWSIALGAVCAAIYDVVCAARVFLCAGKLRAIIGDVLFFVLCGILTSLFALPFNKGNVRIFIVFGEAVGFLCYRLTLGRVAGRFYGIMSKGIAWFLRKICELLKNFFDLLLKSASFLLYNVDVLKDRFIKSVSAKRKKVRKKKQNSRTVGKKDRRRSKKAARTRRGSTENRKRKSYERRYEKEKKSSRKRGRNRKGA